VWIGGSSDTDLMTDFEIIEPLTDAS
jgi:hypothetical protein